MNELVIHKSNLPDTINDLSRFVLVGREKLNSVRAEIRAIDKLKLAEEVRTQKREEAKMLSEAILDAEVRLGQLFKNIPTEAGKRTDIQPMDNEVHRLSRTKKETVENLGFSQRQTQRLEMLADTPELVEYVKAEARENGNIATRTRVLDLAAYQKRQDADYIDYINLSATVYKEFAKIIDAADRFEVSDARMEALRENFDENMRVDEQIGYIDEVIDKLQIIKTELRRVKKYAKQ